MADRADAPPSADERIRLDMHAHLAPILPERLTEIAGVDWRADDETLVLDGRALAVKNLFRPDALIAWMDQQRIDEAWISAPPPSYRQHLAAEEARQWTRYLNDGLAGVAKRHPRRLSPLSHLPIEHPALAAEIASEEIARGQRKFAAPAGDGAKLRLSDAAYDPLWATLDAARCFLLLHPVECPDPRLKPFYLENLLGGPYEAALAAAHLAFAGVPQRFPGLDFCLVHGGGAAPLIASRLARAHRIGRPGVDPAGPSPTEALGRVYADCILHDATALELAAKVFGADKIVFGSDWPFPMGLPDPHLECAASDASQRRRIFIENSARLRERFAG